MSGRKTGWEEDWMGGKLDVRKTGWEEERVESRGVKQNKEEDGGRERRASKRKYIPLTPLLNCGNSEKMPQHCHYVSRFLKPYGYLTMHF